MLQNKRQWLGVLNPLQDMYIKILTSKIHMILLNIFRDEDQDLHNSVCSDLNNLITDHKIDLQTKSKVSYEGVLIMIIDFLLGRSWI